MKFDAVKFLNEEFGVAAQLVARVGVYMRSAPTVEAVEKWYRRGSIPSAWLPVLLSVKELETGAAVRLAQYLGEGEP
jgi:hypothetical protein